MFRRYGKARLCDYKLHMMFGPETWRHSEIQSSFNGSFTLNCQVVSNLGILVKFFISRLDSLSIYLKLNIMLETFRFEMQKYDNKPL